MGEASNLAEIEVITTVLQTYKNIGLDNLVLKISDRKILRSIILNAGFTSKDEKSVCITIDKLDKIQSTGVKDELIGKGFENSKIDKLMSSIDDILNNGLESLKNYGVEDSLIENIKEIITLSKKFCPNDYDVKFDISIVRGQGYYTGTVFETYCTASDYKGALGGGGRYDNMLEKYLGYNVPAVGYGLGLVPTMMMVAENNKKYSGSKLKIAIFYEKDTLKETMLAKKFELNKKYDVSLFPYPKNFKDFIIRLENSGFDGYYKMYSDKMFLFNE